MAQANRKRKAEPVVAPVPRPDWLVLALAGAGALVSGYLTWLKLTATGAAFCISGSGCDIVQASRYATFLWLPTALWGLAVYVAIGAVACIGLGGRNWLIAFLLAAGGAGFSLYLTALSIFEIGATCAWCVTSTIIFLAALAAVLMRRPVQTGRTPSLRPLRLTTYGALAAIGAVVFGAFVFAAPSSAPVGYQLALARHLAQSKAVMYGAYW